MGSPRESSNEHLRRSRKGFREQVRARRALKFRSYARRNKLFGLWAAGKLGLAGADADAYAQAVVIADLQEAGDEDVIGKVKTDFAAKGVDQSDHQIRRTLDEMLATAVQQIQSEG